MDVLAGVVSIIAELDRAGQRFGADTVGPTARHVDIEAERCVTAEMIRSKAARSVFEGTTLRGWPVLTALRGEIVATDGRPVERPPAGRFVARATG